MKTLFLLLICSCTFVSYTQTALIAHKSHSGSSATYVIDPNSNFGEVQFPENFRSYFYDSINDTTVICTISNGYTMQLDTLRNGQLESLETFRMEDIRIQQRILDSIQHLEDSLQQKTKPEENTILPVSTPGKGNPPSFLLVLFSVSAVLLLLIRLVFRDRKPVVVSTIAVFFSMLSFSHLEAQTALIAHKSHSGSSATYFIDPNSNFGVNPHAFDNMKRFEYTYLNDSAVIRELRNGLEEVFAVDTLPNLNKQSLADFEQSHSQDLELYLVEFERKQMVLDSIKRSEDSIFMHKLRVSPVNEQNDVAPIISNPGKGNPPSFLMVLFSVSAVLMILVRMVVRERKTIAV